MRHLAPDGKDIPLLPVRAARTYDPSAGSEHKEQVKVIRWWDGSRERAGAHLLYKLPYYALYAVPNAGLRSVMLGSRMKQEGLRAGVPDLCLAVVRAPWHGFYAELKYGANKASTMQADYLAYLHDAGYHTGTYWSAETCIDAIQDYLDSK